MPISEQVKRRWAALEPHLGMRSPARLPRIEGNDAPALAPEANHLAAEAIPSSGPAVTGDVRIHPGFVSNILQNQRDLWVYLPPGYWASGDRHYPVLYMHDGANLFDPEASFGGQAWDVDATAEWLIQSGQMPPLVIVGIANTPDRLAEYTWVPGTDGEGGRGADHARFVVEEVRPFIEGLYRILPGREHTGVMGSSLGGLSALYMGAYHGDVFGKVGAMSPSLWWSDRRILADLAGIRGDLRIWLDMGSQEGEDESEWQANLEDAGAMRRLLESHGYRDGEGLLCWEAEGADHSESAWASRAALALHFLFEADDVARLAPGSLPEAGDDPAPASEAEAHQP